MRRIVLFFAVALAGVSAQGQGTINFYNRGLTGPNNTTYNAPIQGYEYFGPVAEALAQLFLLTGSGASVVYTPVAGMQSFRPPPNHGFFVEPVLAIVPGQPAGTTGLQFVVRMWLGETYDSATIRGQSVPFTVGPLGGEDPAGEPPIPPPDLGGPDGVGGLVGFTLVPEPSTYAIAALGALLLAAYKRRGVRT